MRSADHNGSAPAQIDYDLHGLVGVRVLNASSRDAAMVEKIIGPLQASLSREPDIVIKFVDQLPLSSRVRYIGLDDAGFTDDAFLIFQSRQASRARVQLRFEQIGKRCEIVCETGAPTVPLFTPILNLTFLSKNCVSLHASGFVYNKTGVVVTGWAKGGKTETLLSFMARGAEYVGDEWVHLTGDGQRMCGSPRRFGVWDWHLSYLPQYRRSIKRSDRARLRTIKLCTRLMDQATRTLPDTKAFPARAMRWSAKELKQRLAVGVSPQKLFGPQRLAFAGTPEKIFWAVSHRRPEILVRPVEPQEIARRTVFSLKYERMKLVSDYLKFRFAFPDVRNELIETAEEIERERLTRLLADKETYLVAHPYPVPLPALYQALEPFVVR